MLSVTETETLAAYMKPPSRYGGGGGAGGLDDNSGGPGKGFVVRDAPWNAGGNKVWTLNIRSSAKKECGDNKLVYHKTYLPEQHLSVFVPGSGHEQCGGFPHIWDRRGPEANVSLGSQEVLKLLIWRETKKNFCKVDDEREKTNL